MLTSWCGEACVLGYDVTKATRSNARGPSPRVLASSRFGNSDPDPAVRREIRDDEINSIAHRLRSQSRHSTFRYAQRDHNSRRGEAHGPNTRDVRPDEARVFGAKLRRTTLAGGGVQQGVEDRDQRRDTERTLVWVRRGLARASSWTTDGRRPDGGPDHSGVGSPDRATLPGGVREALPVVLMVLAISVPVGLLALSTLGDAALMLSLAVAAMLLIAVALVQAVNRMTAEQVRGDEDGARRERENTLRPSVDRHPRPRSGLGEDAAARCEGDSPGRAARRR